MRTLSRHFDNVCMCEEREKKKGCKDKSEQGKKGD